MDDVGSGRVEGQAEVVNGPPPEAAPSIPDGYPCSGGSGGVFVPLEQYRFNRCSFGGFYSFDEPPDPLCPIAVHGANGFEALTPVAGPGSCDHGDWYVRFAGGSEPAYIVLCESACERVARQVGATRLQYTVRTCSPPLPGDRCQPP